MVKRKRQRRVSGNEIQGYRDCEFSQYWSRLPTKSLQLQQLSQFPFAPAQPSFISRSVFSKSKSIPTLFIYLFFPSKIIFNQEKYSSFFFSQNLISSRLFFVKSDFSAKPFFSCFQQKLLQVKYQVLKLFILCTQNLIYCNFYSLSSF